MRKNYMDAYEQILQQRISESKKQRMKLLRARPNKRYKGTESVIVPKSPQPKPKQYSVAYIDNAFKIMKESESTLVENPSSPIRIDNAYGDYAMSIFRRKDKLKRLEDIPKLFTSDFKSKLIGCFPPGCDKLVDDLIKGRIKASSFTPQPKIQKLHQAEGYVRKRSIYKDLEQLNEQMRYQYFVDQQPSQSSRAKLHGLQQNARSSSYNKLVEHQNRGFLPQIAKAKKGLIFKSQSHTLHR